MLWTAWDILCESAVFILFGFLLAGLLDGLLSGRRVIGYLSGSKTRSVLLGTLIGAPLPLCSCSVLPAALTLRRKGASRGATLSFLVSTPETSVTSVLLTYALLGPALAIIRPIAACASAIAAGLAENLTDPNSTAGPPENSYAGECGQGGCCVSDDVLSDDDQGTDGVRHGLRRAFVNLFDSIFIWIVIGIFVAAAIQAWLPPEVLTRILGGELQSMLLMILIGVPLYVCNEASTPIAAAFIAQGVSPGAGLVFLLVGPATNIGSLGVLYQQLGRRTVMVYLITIVVVALAAGVVTNDMLETLTVGLQSRVLDEPLVPTLVKQLGAILFIILGIASLRRTGVSERIALWLKQRLSLPVTRGGVRVGTVVIVLAAYFASGFYMVWPGEVGIVRRFGAIVQADAQPGLHYAWPYPIDAADRVAVPAVRRTVVGLLDESSAVSAAPDSWNLIGDENIADIQAVVHWSVDPNEVIQFQYGIADREALVTGATLAMMREVFAGTSINTVFTIRRRAHEHEIESRVADLLRSYNSGITVESFRLLYTHAPSEVHESFRDVASALEDRSTQINEARAQEAELIPLARGEAAWKMAEAGAYAARKIADARGQADRFVAILKVYAEWPRITARRLEFEMLEKVLPKLRKYLRPAARGAGEIDIWFVQPDATDEPAIWPSGPTRSATSASQGQ
ncbi:MAG: SO_0444 family Cu/Zn efflux transporter [Phycisphaerae bacterium]|nr:SO_0444 family Cu/Zn efflux transporter [Phycisphaerae bacterium]